MADDSVADDSCIAELRLLDWFEDLPYEVDEEPPGYGALRLFSGLDGTEIKNANPGLLGWASTGVSGWCPVDELQS